MGFSPRNYNNHFKGKQKQPKPDLEHKLFTKFNKKKNQTADQLILAEPKEGSEVPRLDDHLQASITGQTSKSQFNRRWQSDIQ